MFDEFNFEYNKELKDALAAATEDYSEDNWLDVICMLTSGIMEGGELLIPVAKLAFFKVDFDPDAEFGDIFPDDLPQDNFTVVEMPDGRKWLPLFTDEDEVQDMGRASDTKLIPISEAFELALLNVDLDGIIINLFSDIFLIPRETLEWILEEIDEVGDDIEGFEGFEDAG